MANTEPATDYLSRKMVPELIDGLMVTLVDCRPQEPKPFLAALLQGATPPEEGKGSDLCLHMDPRSMTCLGVLGLLRKAEIAHKIAKEDVPEGSTKKHGFEDVNPNRKVPALRDGASFSVFESNAIMRYVCNKFVQAQGFYPVDFEKRAVCDMALDWRQTEWYKAISTIVYPALGFAPSDAKAESNASEALTGLFKILECHFLGGRADGFICGSELTIADFAIAPPIAMLTATEKKTNVEIPSAVRAYFERFCKVAEFDAVLDMEGGWNKLIHAVSSK